MFRKYVIVTFAVMMCLGTSSCTSKKAEEQGSDVEVSANDDALEEADAKENNSDLDTGGSSSGSDVAASDDLGGSELDDLGGDSKGDGGSAVADSGGEVTTNDLDGPPPADTAAPPPDASNDMAATPPADAPPASDVAASEPPPPEPEAAPSTVPVTTVDSGATEEPKPATGSLQKIKSSPEKIGKTLVNAVYIARDGDSVESIAQKVGVKQKDLCRANSFNCSRPAKVGDKFYYNSPQRPTDDTVVKTFYEDAGLQPEVYVAKSGDNIRKVGKELLGHERSWMEIWATNDVESKGDLEEGVQLKYWPKTDVAAPAMAKTDAAAPPADAPPAPPAEQAATETPPPAPPSEQPPQQAANDLPPSPDANAPAAAGTVEPPPPPPPPPPADNAAPPADSAAPVAGAAGQDPDQTMMLGVGAVLLLAAAALFISIRKKRQRRQIDFNTTTQTQIE